LGSEWGSICTGAVVGGEEAEVSDVDFAVTVEVALDDAA
jgi:hypothetical protein